MKPIYYLALFLFPIGVMAQSKSTNFIIPKKATINFSEVKEDYFTALQCVEKPVPGGIPDKSKMNLNTQENTKIAAPSGTLTPIFLGKNFLANPFGNSTPNDNDMAISNNCKIVSVSNTLIYFHDCVVDSSKGIVSLSAFSLIKH